MFDREVNYLVVPSVNFQLKRQSQEDRTLRNTLCCFGIDVNKKTSVDVIKGNHIVSLSTTYVVRWKVMFSLVCVILFTGGVVGYVLSWSFSSAGRGVTSSYSPACEKAGVP